MVYSPVQAMHRGFFFVPGVAPRATPAGVYYALLMIVYSASFLKINFHSFLKVL